MPSANPVETEKLHTKPPMLAEIGNAKRARRHLALTLLSLRGNNDSTKIRTIVVADLRNTMKSLSSHRTPSVKSDRHE